MDFLLSFPGLLLVCLLALGLLAGLALFDRHHQARMALAARRYADMARADREAV